MTHSKYNLPVEVWQNVLDHIQDNKQWIKCKLVCKMWVPMVEMAMLKSVVLTKRYAKTLYQHLLEHPNNARYIQRIKLPRFDGVCNSPYLEDLFKLAITNNLKAITGILDGACLTMLLRVVQDSTTNVKLELIPVDNYVNKASLALLNHFKETLTSMKLNIWDTKDMLLANSLGQPKNNLIKLHISDHTGRLFYLNELNAILHNCVYLESLLLLLWGDAQLQVEKLGLKEWRSKEKIAHVESMRSITCVVHEAFVYKGSGACGINLLLWYLAVKYPRLDYIRLMAFEHYETTTTIDTSVFDHVKTVDLKNWRFYKWEDVAHFMCQWKSQANSVTIEYKDSFEKWGDKFCYMTMVRSKQRNHTQFILRHIDQETPVDIIIKILSTLKTCVMDKCYQGHVSIPLPAFDDTLQLAASSTTSNHNVNSKIPPTTTTTGLVHTLELINMNLEIHDFTHLAELFPCLDHLTLTSCCMDVAIQKQQQHQQQQAYRTKHVTLPSIHLRTLTLQTNRSLHYTKVNAQSEILGDAFILISLGLQQHDAQQGILFAGANNKSIVRLSRDDFDQYSPEHATAELIYIRCKSLMHLVVRINAIQFELALDDKGHVVTSNPPIIDATETQLKEGILSGSSIEMYYKNLQRQQSLLQSKSKQRGCLTHMLN